MLQFNLQTLRCYRGFDLMLFSSEQGRSCAQHTHDFVEVVLVRDGTARHSIFNSVRGKVESYSLIRGDFFVIMPGEIHSFNDNKGLLLFNLAISIERLKTEEQRLATLPSWNKIFGEKSPLKREKLHLFPGEYARAEHLLLRLMGILEKVDANDYRMLEAESLLYEYLIMIGTHAPDEWHTMNGDSDSRIPLAIKNMENNLQSPFSVRTAARNAAMCESLFARKFRDAVGLSPLAYMTRLRLEKCRSLLQETKIPLSEIAAQTGFSDSNYLVRMFRKHYGLSPAKYRKQHVL